MIFIVASSIEEVGERSWKILNHFDSPTQDCQQNYYILPH